MAQLRYILVQNHVKTIMLYEEKLDLGPLHMIPVYRAGPVTEISRCSYFLRKDVFI